MKDALIIAVFAAAAVVVGALLLYWHGGMPLPRPSGTGGLAGAAVPFSEIASGTHSAVADRKNFLITSEEEFGKLWSLISATGTPPAVDFAKETVIAIFAGEKPTTGYGVMVSNVEDSAHARMVSVTLTEPGENCIEGQAITSPYEVLKLPASSLPLSHADETVTKDCTQ